MPAAESKGIANTIATTISQIELNGQDFVGLLSPLAIIISVFAASWFANQKIKHTRKLTKQRTTMEFIMDRSRDEAFFSSFRVVRDIDADNKIDIRFFAERQDFDKKIEQERSEEKAEELKEDKKRHDLGVECLNYLLNQYEYMAVGIKQDIYDEEMLINATRSSTVSAYKITHQFIDGVRETLKVPSAYIEFETLAQKWDKLNPQNSSSKQ